MPSNGNERAEMPIPMRIINEAVSEERKTI